MKTANFNQKNTKYIPTRYFLSRHLGHLKPPRTFLTRHLFIDGHLLPSAICLMLFVTLEGTFVFKGHFLSYIEVSVAPSNVKMPLYVKGS